MKCDRCSYISFDHSHECPTCGRDLAIVRRKLGIRYEVPEANFDEMFTGGSGAYRTSARRAAAKRENEAELDLKDVGEDFEFTLDD